jgi:hypothetical protein
MTSATAELIGEEQLRVMQAMRMAAQRKQLEEWKAEATATTARKAESTDGKLLINKNDVEKNAQRALAFFSNLTTNTNITREARVLQVKLMEDIGRSLARRASKLLHAKRR